MKFLKKKLFRNYWENPNQINSNYFSIIKTSLVTNEIESEANSS